MRRARGPFKTRFGSHRSTQLRAGSLYSTPIGQTAQSRFSSLPSPKELWKREPNIPRSGTINRRDKRHCEAIFDISSTTGITTGDLLDATQRFRQERALYPWPQKIDVDDADRGSFHVRVDLKAEIPGAEWVDLYAQHTSSCFDQETLKYECPGRLEEEARIARGNGTDLSSRPQILSSSCADFRGL